MSATAPNYNHTVTACFVGYITQAVINNFMPLLFVTFAATLGIDMARLSALITVNFVTQLVVDVLAGKFVDRIGYDNWDPFQKPNDPLDVRLDVTKRTTQQLVREFLQLKAARNEQYGNDYGRGVLECALGIVNRDEKFQGITDFCLWYHDLLKKEGHIL